jgi:hypothetical protein
MKLLFIQGSDFFEQFYSFLIPRADYAQISHIGVKPTTGVNTTSS